MNSFSFSHRMRKTVQFACCLVVMASLLLVASCGGDDDVAAPASSLTFDKVIDGTADPVDPGISSRETVEGSEENLGDHTETDGSVWRCTRETVRVDNVPDQYPVFDPTSEVVWPGNLLQGAYLADNPPRPIPVQRGGGTLSINLVNGTANVTKEVAELTKSNVSQALNDIIAANNGILKANFVFNKYELHSREQLGIEMNASYDGLTTDVQGSLGFSSDREYKRTLVTLTQQYYTISQDLPTSRDNIFGPEATPEELARFVGEGNPPTFISSVTYGRMFYLLIESTSSIEEINAAISASYAGGVADAAFDASAKYVNELENVNVKVFAVGGDPSTALATFSGDYEAIRRYLNDGGSIETGTPLSYIVRSVKDPSQVVRTKVATTYDVVNCTMIAEPNPIQNIEVSVTFFKAIKDCDTDTAGDFTWTVTGFGSGPDTGFFIELGNADLNDGERQSLNVKQLFSNYDTHQSITLIFGASDDDGLAGSDDLPTQTVVLTYDEANYGAESILGGATGRHTVDLEANGSCHAQFTYEVKMK